MLIGTIKIQQHQTPLANRINPLSPPASNPPRQPPAVESPAGFILPGGRQSGQAPAELRRRTVSQGEAGSSRFARARAGAAERRGRGSGGVPGPPEPQARPRRRFPGPRDSEPQCAERGPRGSPGAGGYLRTSRPRPHAGGWVGLGRPLSERQGVRAGPAARTPGPDRPAGGRRGGHPLSWAASYRVRRGSSFKAQCAPPLPPPPWWAESATGHGEPSVSPRGRLFDSE